MSGKLRFENAEDGTKAYEVFDDEGGEHVGRVKNMGGSKNWRAWSLSGKKIGGKHTSRAAAGKALAEHVAEKGGESTAGGVDPAVQLLANKATDKTMGLLGKHFEIIDDEPHNQLLLGATVGANVVAETAVIGAQISPPDKARKTYDRVFDMAIETIERHRIELWSRFAPPDDSQSEADGDTDGEESAE